MNKQQETLLQAAGWEIVCESPFEIRHEETGSFASRLAADAVIRELEDEAASDTVLFAPDWPFEKFVGAWRDKLVTALVFESPGSLVLLLDKAYQQLDAWQVAKGIRQKPRQVTKGDELLRADVTNLVSRFLADGTSGVQTGLFSLMSEFASTR